MKIYKMKRKEFMKLFDNNDYDYLVMLIIGIGLFILIMRVIE